MRRLMSTLLLASALPLFACDGASKPADPANPGLGLAASALERDLSPEVPPGDMAALVADDTAFACDLYHQLVAAQTAPDNLVLSPHSVSVALAMTYAGAEGETEAQMAAALGFSLPEPQLHEAFNALDLALASRGEGAQGKDGEPFRLRVVNATWAQYDFPFLDPFLDVLGVNYGAAVHLMDFVSAPEPSRLAINAWVSEQTDDRIPELLPQGVITSATALVLTNAVYFNAAWQHQFEPALTADAPFSLLDGSSVSVPTMVQTDGFEFAQTDAFTALELPYDGGEVSMLLLTSDDLATLEASLDPALLDSVDAALSRGEVEVHLPKFGYRSPSDLVPALRALGMTDAFDPSMADLSGMDGGRDLYISAVLHEAFILLDEQGTEAAAATAVSVNVTGMPLDPAVLRFDKPFIYLIRDVATGAIIFIGRVVDPRS